jgi:glycosyltransferase involved in cell wall biosynthesis
MNYPLVSVVIPCRNEASFIRRLIKNLQEQDYPKDKWEVFIIDGLSDDGTTQIIKEQLHKYAWLKLLNNQHKIVPYALNQAIEQSKGELIIRMDVHSSYPTDYISALVKNSIELKADNVGGVWITEPGSDTLMAKAIAVAISHKFGIGNADYRTGSKEIKEVDTVPFGCYPKKLFDRIGLFDVTMVRTEDDEFNARLLKNGRKIFLIPSIEIKYFARETLPKISKMFYQYALFKPLANLKIGHPATLRQLVPSCLMLALAGSAAIAALFQNGYWVLLIIAGGYLLTDIIVSILLSLRRRAALWICLPIIFPVIHFSYGWGYLKGIWDFVILRKQTKGNSIDVSINR